MSLPVDPNVSTISGAGLAIESLANIISFLESALQSIYGSDVNLESNSPDGQLINIFAQSDIDYLELLLDTYNNFAVPTSYGPRLDQLVALNGLARQQGTYTQAQVAVTASQAITVPGLDQTAVPAFTVADEAGNQFQLVTSLVFASAGTQTVTFQAVTIGVVTTIANTITNIVTATLGITSVNNPSVASDIIGVNEESDAQLQIRHDQSFTLASTGMSDAMESLLRNIPGVTDAYVVENDTGATVGPIPKNCIWVIVAGGTAAQIAQAIYVKKSPGCAMKGSVSQLVTRPNGSTFAAQWDVAISQPLYIAFTVNWVGPQLLSNSQVAVALAPVLVYKLGQTPSIGDVLRAMQAIAPTAILSISATQGVSVDNSSWASIVEPTDAQHYFTVSSANITVST
jgi:uncharacterized phage protein gp47/JayE